MVRMGNREVHNGSAFDSEGSLREKDGYIQALNSKRYGTISW